MEVCKHCSNKLAFFTLLLGIIFCGGCWDAKDLANLAIVSAVGIDLDEKQPGQLLVTIQIIKPGEIKSASGGGDSGGGGGGGKAAGKKQAFLMVSSSGKTVSEAFRNFTNQVNRELYLADNQIIVFSKEAAQKGVLPFLDYFIRTRQPRETVWILVADGKASQVIETNLGLEKIPALETTRLIINRETASQASAATQHEFISRLLIKTAATYTSFIRVSDKLGEKKILLTGTAVFKGDKFVGEFDKTETRGFLWIINKVKRGTITVKSPAGEYNDLGILRSNSKIVPEISGGKINLKIAIEVECGLTGETKPEDFTKPEIIKSLEALTNQAIRKEVKATLSKAFQLDADVFEFGEAIHRKYPKQWKNIKPVWDRLFLTTGVSIKIKTKLKSEGLNIKPLLPK